MPFRDHPSRSTLRLFYNAAAGCSVAGLALLAEERRRRIALAQRIVENGRRLQGYKAYHGNAAIAVFDTGEPWHIDLERLPGQSQHHDAQSSQDSVMIAGRADTQSDLVMTNKEWRERGRSKRHLPTSEQISAMKPSQSTSTRKDNTISLDQWHARMQSVPLSQTQPKTVQDFRPRERHSTATPVIAPTSLEIPKDAGHKYLAAHEAHARAQTVKTIQQAFRKGLGSRLANACTESDRLKVYAELQTYFIVHDERISPGFRDYINRLRGCGGKHGPDERNTRTWQSLPIDMRAHIQQACQDSAARRRYQHVSSEGSALAMRLQHEPIHLRQGILGDRLLALLAHQKLDEAYLALTMGMNSITGPFESVLRNATRALIDTLKALACPTLVLELHKNLVRICDESSMLVDDLAFLLAKETNSMRVVICRAMLNTRTSIQAMTDTDSCRPVTLALTWLLENVDVSTASIVLLKLDPMSLPHDSSLLDLTSRLRSDAEASGKHKLSQEIHDLLQPIEKRTQKSMPMSLKAENWPQPMITQEKHAAFAVDDDKNTLRSFQLFEQQFIRNLRKATPESIDGRSLLEDPRKAFRSCLKANNDTSRIEFMKKFGYSLVPLNDLERVLVKDPHHRDFRAAASLFASLSANANNNHNFYEKLVQAHQNLDEYTRCEELNRSFAKELYLAYAAVGTLPQIHQAISRLTAISQPESAKDPRSSAGIDPRLEQAHSVALMRVWQFSNNLDLVTRLFDEIADLPIFPSQDTSVLDCMIRISIKAKDWRGVQRYCKLGQRSYSQAESLQSLVGRAMVQATSSGWNAADAILLEARGTEFLPGSSFGDESVFDVLVEQFSNDHDSQQTVDFVTRLQQNFKIAVSPVSSRYVMEKLILDENMKGFAQWLEVCSSTRSSLFICDGTLRLILERRELPARVVHYNAGSRDNIVALVKVIERIETKDFADYDDENQEPAILMDSVPYNNVPNGEASKYHQSEGESFTHNKSPAYSLKRIASKSKNPTSVSGIVRAMHSAEAAEDFSSVRHLYNDSLVGGLPRHPVLVALAVNSTLKEHGGRTDSAIELITNAEKHGAKVQQARQVVLLHDIRTMDLSESNAKAIVLDTFNNTEEDEFSLRHHQQILHAVVQRLVAQGQPGAALRVCQEVQLHCQAGSPAFDIRILTTLMASLIDACDHAGMCWVHETVMRFMRPDRGYQYLLRQKLKIRSGPGREVTSTLLAEWLADTKTLRASQLTRTQTFLVEIIKLLKSYRGV